MHTSPYRRDRFRLPAVAAGTARRPHPRPPARRGLVLVLVLAALAGAPTPARAASLPPQGVYEGCSPGTTAAQVQVCVDRLRMVRDAGFVIVLNYSALYGSPEQVRVYASAADELGIRLIWPLHHRDLHSKADVSTTFIAMARACGCSSPHELIPFMVGVVKDSPATFMYYVGDETPFEMHDGLAANSRLVAETDPAHPRFFVAWPFPSFDFNLEPFADDADVLAGDPYPIGVTNRVEDVADATRAVQRIADAHGRQAAMVLQSFSWGPNYADRTERWPTVDEYRTMRDLALASGRPRFILWWATYVILRSDEPQRRWSELVRGAMAPAPLDPAPPSPAPASPAPHDPAVPPAPAVAWDGLRRVPVPTVRMLSVTRHGRIVRVRFALTRAAPTKITARSVRWLGKRSVQGRLSLQTVAMRLDRGAPEVAVRVTPAGGASVRRRVGLPRRTNQSRRGRRRRPSAIG